MIKGEKESAQDYEEELCMEWFKNKITEISREKRKERNRRSLTHNEVATDITQIRPKYILNNGREVQIEIPDIRLPSGSCTSAELVLYTDDTEAERIPLGWYGNEIGKTIMGISVPIPENKSTVIDIRIEILCNGQLIHNSEKKMRRNEIFFSGSHETQAGQIEEGYYTLVIPKISRFDAEDCIATEIEDWRSPGTIGYFIELDKDFIFSVDGRIFLNQKENSSKTIVLIPKESKVLPHIELEGNDCMLAYKQSSCDILLGSGRSKENYVILMNGKKASLKSQTHGEGEAIRCGWSDINGICNLQVLDLKEEKQIFDSTLVLVGNADCGFNREFYYSDNDYINAEYHMDIDNYSETVPVAKSTEIIEIPFRAGTLTEPVPKVTVEETTGKWFNGELTVCYIDNIPLTSTLLVTAPAGIRVSFSVNGESIPYDQKNGFPIGNILHAINGEQAVVVTMWVYGRKSSASYILTRVFYKEMFTKTPSIWKKENKLYWDKGGVFIGKSGRCFLLTMKNKNGAEYSFNLKETEECVELPDGFPCGDYSFEVSVSTNGLFKKDQTILADGSCTMGDENELRFIDRTIVIDSITDELRHPGVHLRIEGIYIDQLEFQGIDEFFGLPLYSGIMFYYDQQGIRRELSSKDWVGGRRGGRKKTAVNPVRVYYAGPKLLWITCVDREGIYYRYEFDKRLCILTDILYTDSTKQYYSVAETYTYHVRKNKIAKDTKNTRNIKDVMLERRSLRT